MSYFICLLYKVNAIKDIVVLHIQVAFVMKLKEVKEVCVAHASCDEVERSKRG